MPEHGIVRPEDVDIVGEVDNLGTGLRADIERLFEQGGLGAVLGKYGPGGTNPLTPDTLRLLFEQGGLSAILGKYGPGSGITNEVSEPAGLNVETDFEAGKQYPSDSKTNGQPNGSIPLGFRWVQNQNGMWMLQQDTGNESQQPLANDVVSDTSRTPVSSPATPITSYDRAVDQGLATQALAPNLVTPGIDDGLGDFGSAGDIDPFSSTAYGTSETRGLVDKFLEHGGQLDPGETAVVGEGGKPEIIKNTGPSPTQITPIDDASPPLPRGLNTENMVKFRSSPAGRSLMRRLTQAIK